MVGPNHLDTVKRELLTMTPELRYRRFLDDYPDLIGVVSQKDIASYLGVTPVGMSRIASRVRKEAASAAAPSDSVD